MHEPGAFICYHGAPILFAFLSRRISLHFSAGKTLRMLLLCRRCISTRWRQTLPGECLTIAARPFCRVYECKRPGNRSRSSILSAFISPISSLLSEENDFHATTLKELPRRRRNSSGWFNYCGAYECKRPGNLSQAVDTSRGRLCSILAQILREMTPVLLLLLPLLYYCDYSYSFTVLLLLLLLAWRVQLPLLLQLFHHTASTSMSSDHLQACGVERFSSLLRVLGCGY